MRTLRNFITKYKYQLINLCAHLLFVLYSVALPYYFGIGLIVGWIMSNLIHYLYMHRIYTHRHFKISQKLHNVFLFLFTGMNLGSPPVYASVHLKHHSHSGDEDDPHNPYRLGLVKSLSSLWDNHFKPERKTFAHFLKTYNSKWYHDNHVKISILFCLLAPFVIVVSYWMSKIVVILVHIKGIGYSHNQQNSDTSRNVWWLKPITWGEELHNNHHYYPGTANHQRSKSLKELDILYYIGKLIEQR